MYKTNERSSAKCLCSKISERSLLKSMTFMSNAGDPIFGIKSLDEETPVLRCQKGRRTSQVQYVRERKCLRASGQGLKRK